MTSPDSGSVTVLLLLHIPHNIEVCMAVKIAVTSYAQYELINTPLVIISNVSIIIALIYYVFLFFVFKMRSMHNFSLFSPMLT